MSEIFHIGYTSIMWAGVKMIYDNINALFFQKMFNDEGILNLTQKYKQSKFTFFKLNYRSNSSQVHY